MTAEFNFSIFNFLDILSVWLQSLVAIWNYLNQPIGIFLDILKFNPLTSTIAIPLSTVLKLVGLYDWTLLEFMLGVGLTVYLAYQFVIWLLNLVT